MGSSKGLVSRGVHFLTRQDIAFNVNMIRRSIENFSNMLVQQYQSIYIIALGANSLQVGIVNSLAGVGTTLTALPAGWAIDRYGLKRTFYFGTMFMALGALFFGLANNWLITIPAMFVFMLAAKINQTSCPVVCGSSLANEDRAVGMQICDSLASISGIVAPLVGAALISASGGLNVPGLRSIFYLQFIVLCVEFLLIWKKFNNPRSRMVSKTTSGLMAGVQDVLREGVAVKRFLLYQSVMMVPFYVNAIYIPLYAAELKRADPVTLGGMATASLLVPLLLSIPSGRLADRLGRKKVVYACLTLYCLSLVLLALAPESSALILMASGVFQGFFTLGFVTANAIRAEIVPVRLLGSWSGLLGLVGGIVGIIVPFSAGLIWNTISPTLVLLFLVASQALAATVLITMPETLKMQKIS